MELSVLLGLVRTIAVGLEKERRATLAYDFEDIESVLPKDLYSLMRDPSVSKAAKDLNVLTGLAEFSKD